MGALRAVPPAPSVDLWIVCLAENDTVSESLLADDGERARLSRILVPARRRSFLFRRVVRRHVLGQYLSGWRIEHTPEGKPHIAGAPPLHFS